MTKICICDDQMEQIELIKSYVADYFKKQKMIVSVDTTTDGKSLLEDIYKYDIVFLDIEIDDHEHLKGITIGEQLFKNLNLKIIYVTEHEHYWLDAVTKSHFFDYLKKPIDREKIERSLNALQGFIKVKDAKIKIKDAEINIDNVLYIEASGNSVFFHFADGNIEKCRCTFEMANNLVLATSRYYISVHRKYTVNMRYIETAGLEIHMMNGKNLPISRGRESIFFKTYQDYCTKGLL